VRLRFNRNNFIKVDCILLFEIVDASKFPLKSVVTIVLQLQHVSSDVRLLFVLDFM